MDVQKRDAFIQRRFYTQKFLHTEAVTHRRCYTQKLLHTDAFTHRDFYTNAFTRTEAFTHRHFYTHPFTHRHFYTQTLSHTDAFTHKHFSRTEAFTHRNFHTQKLLHTNTFTHRDRTREIAILPQFYLRPKNSGSELGENCPVAKVRNCIQAIAANKVTVGDRVLVLISGSVPSELRYLRHFKEEGECHRLALDPGLPIESFHALEGIWTKGQEPHHLASILGHKAPNWKVIIISQKHALLHHAKHNDLQVPVIKGLACCIMPSVSVIHNWFGASCPYKNCLEPSGRHSTSFIRQAQPKKHIRN